ncbi:MAG: 16S rRNA (guanine(966)-N(2))-methyltransferase RsmD [Nitrospirae bacterium]|nr:16S rRNA (guanine(966)-N(2))-methyltransferase RsmD [Nitrospirota bacterium]
MKISAGQFKGRKIGSRKMFGQKGEQQDLRPTSSKVREALFDILRSEIYDAVFLDLYAGTGTVGFEALSRGAQKTFFVEDNPVRSGMINELIAKLGLKERARIFRENAAHFLKRASAEGLSFDIIFADPPYKTDELDIILPLIETSGILKTDGWLIVEHPSKNVLKYGGATIKVIKEYRYGDTMLTRYRKVLS